VVELRDEDLMLLAREGDEEAFATLVTRHRVAILNFIYRMLGDREVAEDLSQEVFVRLWANAKTYAPVAKFTTFIYHIARNLCRDQIDKYRRLPPIASLSQEVPDAEGHVHLLEDEVRDRRGGPQAELLKRERDLEIEAAINALSEEQRTIFVLTELQGMSYREVADVVGCPVGTVASRKSAAFKALRDRLAPLQS
jgi:RNA polymerase sigma-70 factor (ECF subfamily)